MQVGTAAAQSPACPRVPAGPAASRRSTHVAEEAELVVLPAKAPVVRPRRSPLLAPAKAAGAGSGHGPAARQLQHPLPCPCPSSLTARWGRTGSVLQLTSAARSELSSIRPKHGTLNPLLGVLATKSQPTSPAPRCDHTNELRARDSSASPERRSPAAVLPGAEPGLGPVALTRTQIQGAGP